MPKTLKVEILIVWFLVVVKGRRIVSNAILHQIYIHEELGPLLENSSFLLGCAKFHEYRKIVILAALK